jgi:hypothetical protein
MKLIIAPLILIFVFVFVFFFFIFSNSLLFLIVFLVRCHLLFLVILVFFGLFFLPALVFNLVFCFFGHGFGPIGRVSHSFGGGHSPFQLMCLLFLLGCPQRFSRNQKYGGVSSIIRSRSVLSKSPKWCANQNYSH